MIPGVIRVSADGRRPPTATRRRHIVRLSALALCICCLACAVNPLSGQREIILMSEDKEKEIDSRESRNVEAMMGLVNAPELAEYIEEVGQAMAAVAPKRDLNYHFDIVEMDAPNAFALPGGHIYISRGLLVNSNSEAEVACVLGHEIGHVVGRHSAQRDVHSKAMSLASVLGTVGAIMAGSGDGRTIASVQALTAGMSAAYGRDQEREADEFGQDLAVVAGVDPMGLADFLRTLENVGRLENGYARGTGFFDSHPGTPERVAEATTRATVYRWKPHLEIAPTRAEFLSRIEGITIGRPASEGIVVAGRFVHPSLEISLVFPKGWQLLNQPSRVLALAPGRDAIVMLELQGQGDDPAEAKADYAEKEKIHFEAGKSIRIGKYEAYRARAMIPTADSDFDTELTWIAFRGQIYRLSAGAARGRFSRYTGVFRSFARNFRELREEERESITELRLRIAVAAKGERLADVSRRSENEWDLNRTAVVNRMVQDDVLMPGTLVKVAVREPYSPPPEPDLGQFGPFE
jgi:predicted Zn-dependent protease